VNVWGVVISDVPPRRENQVRKYLYGALLLASACGGKTVEAVRCGPWAHLYQGNCTLNGAVSSEADAGSDPSNLSSVDAAPCQGTTKNVIHIESGVTSIPDLSLPITMTADNVGGSFNVNQDTQLFRAISTGFAETVDNNRLQLNLEFWRWTPPFQAADLVVGVYPLGSESSEMTSSGFFFAPTEARGSDGMQFGRYDICDDGNTHTPRTGAFEVTESVAGSITIRFSVVCLKTPRSVTGCAHIRYP
jgi:hypothetical protein